MLSTSLKVMAAAAALGVAGTASSVVASGEIGKQEIVVASLIILPATDAAYPLPKLGVARALEFVPGETEAVEPEQAPAGSEAALSEREPSASEPQVDVEASPVEDVAALADSESYQEYMELNDVAFIPVPTPRPDVGVAPRVEAPVLRQRPQQPRRAAAAARRTETRVAQIDEPRRRTLRANPILIGIHR